MVPQVGYSGPILDKPPKRFYMVLKIGDYVSGWLDADALTTEGAKAHPSCKDRTLQTKWDEFQNRPDFRVDPEKLPGGVRFQMVMGESLSSSGIAAS
ncbi:MAG: hypothetical protein C0402_05305 [Thermodesulfovibrio sp.]|nr:hypothetical protein [Thermodesulfovibrio sp.]